MTGTSGSPARAVAPVARPVRDAEQESAWLVVTTAVRVLLDTVDRRMRREVGLPASYLAILARLAEVPGTGLRMNHLARATGFAPSALAHAVARLEEAGLVRRHGVDGDRRGTLVALTDAGGARIRAAGPRHDAAVREHLVARLDAEQVGALRRISEALLG